MESAGGEAITLENYGRVFLFFFLMRHREVGRYDLGVLTLK